MRTKTVKLTFPVWRGKFKPDGYDDLYIVMCTFSNGSHGIADFWGMPYTARNYNTAVILKESIVATAKKIPIWNTKHFFIGKITI